MRRDCRKTCNVSRPTFLRMSNQASPVVHASIGKVGVPSVSGGYGTAICFRTIGLMLFDRGHAKDVPLLGERFSASYHFKLLTLIVHQNYRKIFFCEKSEPLAENFPNFATKGFTGTSIRVFCRVSQKSVKRT